jgi:hypothetical protein
MDPRSIIDDLTWASKRWTRQRKAEERAARHRASRQEAMVRSEVRSKRITIKDAAFRVMEEAIAKTSGGGRVIFPKRNLFYSVRKLIQEHTSEALRKSNFEGIVKAWEKEHGQIEDMYCDPRGFFIEPHTGHTVPLGTREVAAYQIPAWGYDKIMSVKKKGFHGVFKQYQIAELFDIGIMCAEGYSSEAGKMLLARAEQSQQMTILCFHDADPYGYNIARTLREATRAGCQINVIDAGLTIGEALEMELQPEIFHRKTGLPQGLELSELERGHFEGKSIGRDDKGRRIYECRRVELNDLASDLNRFITWVVSKLEQHGCTRKLVPPQKVVQEKAKSYLANLLDHAARFSLSTLLHVEEMVENVKKWARRKINLKDMPAALTDWAEEPKAEAWGAAMEQMITNRVANKAKAVRDLARKRIAQSRDGASGAGR